VQPQDHTQVRGRHRRTDALHSHRAPDARPGKSSDEAAYRALLTSTEPLTAAAPQVSLELDAYRALLASDAPLTPAGASRDLLGPPRRNAYQAPDGPLGVPPAQAEDNRAARRAAARTSHRAAREPLAPALFGERGRHAVMTAALIAGVGVAGVSVAAAGVARAEAAATAQPRTETASHTGLSSPVVATTFGGTAYSTAVEPEPADSTPAVAYVRTQRKVKPVPVAKSEWVNPMPEGGVTSCFGQRWGRLHAGVDLAAAEGTPIRAAGAGIVVAAGPADGYGNAVLIDHGNGYLTHYGHMSVLTVTVGQHLKTGEQIGDEGSTGHSTGPHLHFEVHEGTYKNPIEPTQWMHDHGVDIPSCVTFTDATKP
jgi:murein DD-endopeptidase MepM/ murein hydrolase activator NlpD